MRLWALVVVFALGGMGSLATQQEWRLSAWLLTLTASLAAAASWFDAWAGSKERYTMIRRVEEAQVLLARRLEAIEQQVEHITKVNALRNLG